MDRRRRRWILIAGIAGCLAAGFGARIIQAWRVERRAADLELAVARLPLGTSVSQAEQLLGTPDEQGRASGVVVNTVLFLDARNSQAARYGAPGDYELRHWRCGRLWISVFSDAEGRIVCKPTGRKPHTSILKFLWSRIGF